MTYPFDSYSILYLLKFNFLSQYHCVFLTSGCVSNMNSRQWILVDIKRIIQAFMKISSGIGRTTAIALAKEGFKVVIAARRDKQGEETLRLVKESRGDGMYTKTAVSNEDSVIAFVEEDRELPVDEDRHVMHKTLRTIY
jgi:short chain dehydrogenase